MLSYDNQKNKHRVERFGGDVVRKALSDPARNRDDHGHWPSDL